LKPRRTFAIISHPDAGKTTLTEKLLLYGGAIHLAGSVTSKKQDHGTQSDWMELEKKRGISVSSTVLNFEYGGCAVNLLDTPGHHDFSEDTYRVLTAVDFAVVVIDAAKGIEPQTRKLFDVCRYRKIPLFTFVNKMDRPSKPPLELMDELEKVFEIPCFPVNWPIGSGPEFKGVFNRLTKQASLYERTAHGSSKAREQKLSVDEVNSLFETTHETSLKEFQEELEILDMAGTPFEPSMILAEKLNPVLFGSAVNNFGIDSLLETLVEYGPGARGRQSDDGEITADNPDFSGFIFKIQANLDARHRGRTAFVRVVSGVFRRNVDVILSRDKSRFSITSAHRIFGRDKELIEEAYPGDIIGIVGQDGFLIGDTIAQTENVSFSEIPKFAPECLAFLSNPVPSNSKKFNKGVLQLLSEGVAHQMKWNDAHSQRMLIGAVGPLQFDVLKYRLETEYTADCRIEPGQWVFGRYCISTNGKPESDLLLPSGSILVHDTSGDAIVLLPDQWTLKYLTEKNPDFTFPTILRPDSKLQAQVAL